MVRCEVCHETSTQNLPEGSRDARAANVVFAKLQEVSVVGEPPCRFHLIMSVPIEPRNTWHRAANSATLPIAVTPATQ